MDFFFIDVGSDAVHGLRDVLGDADPSSPLFKAYWNHFSVDSLVSYFASGHFGCHVEDFLKLGKRPLSKPLSLCLDLVSDLLDTA